MISFILSGGSGTRLWPVSRPNYAKPLAPLFDKSLLEMTIERLKPAGKVQIISSNDSKILTDRLIESKYKGELPVFYEPEPRNTAAAVALACHICWLSNQRDQIIGIFAADAFIENQDEFLKSINLAADISMQDYVVTLGLRPSYPATGFGYINVSDKILASENALIGFEVDQFCEKPQLSKAEEFIKTGKHFWNSGIFIFKVRKMVEHFQNHLPELWENISKIDADFSNLNEIYPNLQKVSIDYGVMEKLKSSEVACVPADLGWSDVGTWDSILEAGAESTPAVDIDCKNVSFFGQKGKTYCAHDLENLIVVDTKDALLITPRGKSEGVKKIVDKLHENKDPSINYYLQEERPWGSFEVLKDTSTFKSKVIEVDSGHQLSYQSHEKREEHWIIVQGEGEVVLDEEIYQVTKGSYIHIPQQSKHRMRNSGNEKLIFIEIQLGDYFGEDDITRYSDDYRRS